MWFCTMVVKFTMLALSKKLPGGGRVAASMYKYMDYWNEEVIHVMYIFKGCMIMIFGFCGVLTLNVGC